MLGSAEKLGEHLLLYLLVVLGGSAFYILGNIVYRLTLHPLAKYPGPFICKLTSLYSAYHSFIGDDRLVIISLHEKYGDLVRYGPNRLLINSKEALKDIYSPGRNVQKSRAYLAFPMAGKTSTHSAVNKREHGRKRRIVNQGVSAQALKDLEPSLIEQIEKLSSKLGERSSTHNSEWTEPRDLANWMNYLTFDVMGKLVFGRDFDIIDKPDNRYIPASIHSATRRTGVMGAMPSLRHVYDILERLFQPEMFRERFRFMAAARGVAQSRIADKEKKGVDIYGNMINAKDPETGEGFTPMELLAESMLLITAGSDTSSTAIASLFFYLSRYPDCHTRLVKELRSTFGSLDNIRTGNELNSCTYLRACIMEAMRMTPPVGGALWREVLPGGLSIGRDLQLPAGVDVGVGIYALHHNTKYFPAPFEYNPDRWLESANNPAHMVELAKAAYCPFSIGPRGCPGQALAMIEISLAAARLMWQYDFRLAPPELGGFIGAGNPRDKHPGRRREKEYQVEDCFTSWKAGPMIQFKDRAVST